MLDYIKNNSLSIALISLAFVLLATLALGLKLYHDSQQKIKELRAHVILPENPSPEEVQKVIQKVEFHYVLPEANPKVVTITGVDELKKNQPFFEQAKDGNILLIFSQKVVLYDPKVDKIIDIAQIRVEASSSASISPSTTKENKK